MDKRMTLNEIFKLTSHEYRIDGCSCKSTTLKVFVSLNILLQFIAFDGVAVSKDGEYLHCVHWDIPNEFLREIKATLLMKYFHFLTGKIKPDKKGHYTLKSFVAEACVEYGGLISVPDYEQLIKHAQKELLYKYP